MQVERIFNGIGIIRMTHTNWENFNRRRTRDNRCGRKLGSEGIFKKINEISGATAIQY